MPQRTSICPVGTQEGRTSTRCRRRNRLCRLGIPRSGRHRPACRRSVLDVWASGLRAGRRAGQRSRGQLLGTVLEPNRRRAPSHLHFEITELPDENRCERRRAALFGRLRIQLRARSWLLADCRTRTSGGDWLAESDACDRESRYDGTLPTDAEVVVASGAGDSATLWSLPADRSDAEQVGDCRLTAGDRYRFDLDCDRDRKRRARRAPKGIGSGTASPFRMSVAFGYKQPCRRRMTPARTGVHRRSGSTSLTSEL